MTESPHKIHAAWIQPYAYGSTINQSARERIRQVTYELIEMANINELFVAQPARNDDRDQLENFTIFYNECLRRGWPVHFWTWNRTDYRIAANRQAQVDNALYWLGRFPDVSGIHMDHIRYPEEKVNGLPYYRPEYANAVTQCVTQIREAVKGVSTDLDLTAAVRVISIGGRRSGGPHPNWERDWPWHKSAQQDALEWVLDGLLDRAYVMAYLDDPAHFAYEAVQWALEGAGDRAVLGTHHRFDRDGLPDETRARIAAAQDVGHEHFCIFTLNQYTSDSETVRFARERELAALLGSTVFAPDVEPPDPPDPPTEPPQVPDWARLAEIERQKAERFRDLGVLCDEAATEYENLNS